MTDMSGHDINVPHLRKTLEHVTDHPEEYDQETWCGTKACIAGHAAVLGGWYVMPLYADGTPNAALVTHDDDEVLNAAVEQVEQRNREISTTSDIRFFPITDNRDFMVRMSDGTTRQALPVSTVAAQLLGLNAARADVMFTGSNRLDSIWKMAERWTGGEIVPTTEQEEKVTKIDFDEYVGRNG